jgi:hypothetical protein
MFFGSLIPALASISGRAHPIRLFLSKAGGAVMSSSFQKSSNVHLTGIDGRARTLSDVELNSNTTTQLNH